MGFEWSDEFEWSGALRYPKVKLPTSQVPGSTVWSPEIILKIYKKMRTSSGIIIVTWTKIRFKAAAISTK